jgi:hypothetical protein
VLLIAALVALLLLIVVRLVLQLQCREGAMEEGGERVSVLVIIALVLDTAFVWFCFDSLRQISVLVALLAPCAVFFAAPRHKVLENDHLRAKFYRHVLGA